MFEQDPLAGFFCLPHAGHGGDETPRLLVWGITKPGVFHGLVEGSI